MPPSVPAEQARVLAEQEPGLHRQVPAYRREAQPKESVPEKVERRPAETELSVVWRSVVASIHPAAAPAIPSPVRAPVRYKRRLRSESGGGSRKTVSRRRISWMVSSGSST